MKEWEENNRRKKVNKKIKTKKNTLDFSLFSREKIIRKIIKRKIILRKKNLLDKRK